MRLSGTLPNLTSDAAKPTVMVTHPEHVGSLWPRAQTLSPFSGLSVSFSNVEEYPSLSRVILTSLRSPRERESLSGVTHALRAKARPQRRALPLAAGFEGGAALVFPYSVTFGGRKRFRPPSSRIAPLDALPHPPPPGVPGACGEGEQGPLLVHRVAVSTP